MATLVLPKQFRILVVENHAEQCADLVNALNEWNYRVHVAESSEVAEDAHQSLLKDARQKALKHRCHLAIVDMRLRDDGDPSDTSGLKLVKDLAPTASIIRSGHGDMKTVREALKPSLEVPERAYDFVGKEDGPEALKQVIEEVSSKLWSRETEILWPDGLDSIQLARQVLAQDSPDLADEITSVLQRLFPKAKRLNLALVESIRSTARPNRALLWVQEDNVSRPVLVELDSAKLIREEIHRYDSYVRSNQSFYRFAGLGRHCILWKVGGLIYGADFASRNVRTFERVFQESSIECIITVLKQVAEPLREWQGHQLPLDGTLFDAYLNSSQDALQCLAEDDDTILLPDSDIRLPSPVCWVLRHREASWVPGARAAVTHGALLAENIIVGDETDIRLIDYEHTGIGHILRDFATLEADILIRAMSDISTPLFSELAFVVAQGETESRDMRSTARVDANPKTRKALEVSFELRYLAAEVTRRTTDSDEYMWALLLTTVDWLVRMTPSHPLYERTRLLGAILCSRLEAGKDAWLSMGYPKWLTSKDREAQEREIGKLRQRLALFETERRSYGRDVPPNILQEIALIRQELRRFGLDQ